MLWMIGGSWKSANKKNRKDSLFRKMSFRAVIKMLYEKKVNGNMKRSEESIMPLTRNGFLYGIIKSCFSLPSLR